MIFSHRRPERGPRHPGPRAASPPRTIRINPQRKRSGVRCWSRPRSQAFRPGPRKIRRLASPAWAEGNESVSRTSAAGPGCNSRIRSRSRPSAARNPPPLLDRHLHGRGPPAQIRKKAQPQHALVAGQAVSNNGDRRLPAVPSAASAVAGIPLPTAGLSMAIASSSRRSTLHPGAGRQDFGGPPPPNCSALRRARAQIGAAARIQMLLRLQPTGVGAGL